MDKGLNFRHLIKTFVPGLFTFFSLFMIMDLLVLKFVGPKIEVEIWKFVGVNNVLIVSLLIPASLFTGIVINTFCFINFIPFIKRHQKRSKVQEDITYYKFSRISFDAMRAFYKTKLFEKPKNISDRDFADFFDVESFLLHEQDMTRLQYIKTGYWYYLEFQLNSIVTIFLAWISLNSNIICRDITGIELMDKVYIVYGTLILGAALCSLLYAAIIKNLKKDRKIELGYILGAYHKSGGKKLKM